MDNFKIIYKILKILEKAMDYDEPDLSLISAEALGISQNRWEALMVMLQEDGYIEGVHYVKTMGMKGVKLTNLRITLKGLGYLEENSFMLNTGLRPGEALANIRSDIDFKKKTVKVTKTYIEKTKKVQNSPKTASSRRTVPIPNDLINLLKEYMLQQPKKEPKDPLFQTTAGKRPTQGYLRKRFKFAGDTAGCGWVNLHTMRHTFASKLFKNKVDIKVISQLLGHKKVSTTYDIYVHFIDNIVEDSVQTLNSGIPETLPAKSRKGEKKKKDIIDIKKVAIK